MIRTKTLEFYLVYNDICYYSRITLHDLKYSSVRKKSSSLAFYDIN